MTTSAEGRDAAPVTQRRSIGIVDDDASIRGALGRLCQAHDMSARGFATAQALFDALLVGARFDCLILDVQMPGEGGLDIQRWMQRRGVGIPVIMITGRDDKRIEARARALGASAYLYKPVDAASLFREIDKAIVAGS